MKAKKPRRNQYVEMEGKRLTISQWAKKTGLPRGTIKRWGIRHNRITSGMGPAATA